MKKTVMVLVATLIVCSLIAGCAPAATSPAPSTQPTTAPTKQVQPTPVPPTPVPPTPVPQKPLVVAVGTCPKEIDPDFAETAAKGNVLRQILELPTWYDENGVLHPQAFESWEVINDGLTYRIKVRQGITLPSGKPLDAEAAKFTFDRMVDSKMLEAGAKNQFPGRVGLVGTEVVDQYTLDLHTKAPSNQVPLRLYVVYLLDPEFYSTATPAEAATNAIGFGPYKLTEFVPDDHITMVANENYWMGKPDVDTLIFRCVPEAASRLAMLETGEVDIAIDILPDDISLVESMPGVRVSWVEGARRTGLAINFRKPYLQDKRVRQALNYAVDWDAIKDSLLGGRGSRLITYRGSTVWSDPNLKAYPYDPVKAKQLLAEANFPMDQQMIIDVPTSDTSELMIAQAVAAQFREIGLKVDINAMEYSVYTKAVADRTINDMVLMGLGGRGVPSQDVSALQIGQQWNPTGWGEVVPDPQFDEFDNLRKQLAASWDDAEQEVLTQKLEAIAYDACPWVFLYHRLVIAGVNERVDWDVRLDAQLFFRTARWAK